MRVKPIKLKIAGLNSFLKEQTIDFKKIMNDGIFGIFGPTGSGKTTIIDAMTLALYGEISRYDGGNANKAFINTSADYMSVMFLFSLKESGKEVFYEVKREYKKRNDGTIKPPSARLLKKKGEDNESEVLADKPSEVTKQIIKIIGLKYDDFTRSVILPQGKFSEFLMLENKARRTMLERIFRLEKYGSGLSGRIAEKKNAQKNKVELIESKIEGYGDISKAVLDKEKEAYDKLSLDLENLKKEKEDKDKRFEILKEYKKCREEYDKYKNEKIELEAKTTEINIKKESLEAAKRADEVYIYFKRFKETKLKIEKNEAQIKENTLLFTESKDKFEEQKKAYDLFIAKKEIEIPELLKRKLNLKQAQELNEYVLKIEKEREILLNSYQQNEKSLKSLNLLLDKQNENKAILEKELEYTLKEKQKNTVESNYRNDVLKGFEKEKEYNEYVKRLDEELKLQNMLKHSIFQEEKELTKTEENIKISNEEYERYFEKLNLYKGKCPCSEEDIIKKHEELTKKGLTFKEKIKKNEERKRLEEGISKKEKELLALSENIEFVKAELSKLEEEKEKAIEEKKALESERIITMLANTLEENKPCPVCGSTKHPNPAKKVLSELCERLEENIEELVKQINALNEKKREFELKKSVEENLKRQYCEDCKTIILEIGDFNKELEEQLLKEEERLLENLKGSLKKYKSDTEEAEEKLKKSKEQLNELNLKKAELNKSILKDKEIFSLSEKKAEQIIPQKEEIEKELNFIKNKVSLNSFFDEKSALIEKDKKREEFEQIEKSKREELNKLLIEMDINNKKIFEIEKEKENIIISGKEKKAFIEKNKEDIYKIVGDADIKEALNETENKINNLTKEEKYLKNILGECEVLKNRLEKEHIELTKENKTFKEIFEVEKEEFKKNMEKSKFESTQSLESAYLSKEKQEALKSETEMYDDKLKGVLDNLVRFETKLKAFNLEECKEDYYELSERVKELSERIEKSTVFKGELKSKVKKLEQDLKLVTELKKDLEEQKHKLDLLSELSAVTQGNKFVEFMAKNQLKYITKEASERLKRLTKGRYSVELDDNGDVKLGALKVEGVNFVIRDYYNGGIRRVPKTLSGGEVFLTSLSLALALSSKIQLKNNAPLEVFFLDEGFGALDNELLDTVMDSLEQLSTEKISVGVITHVEALKARIQSKLIVKPQTSGGEGTIVEIE